MLIPSWLEKQSCYPCEARILQCSDLPLGGLRTVAGQCSAAIVLSSLGLAALPSPAQRRLLQQCPTYW